jgi:hypothetical protein
VSRLPLVGVLRARAPLARLRQSVEVGSERELASNRDGRISSVASTSNRPEVTSVSRCAGDQRASCSPSTTITGCSAPGSGGVAKWWLRLATDRCASAFVPMRAAEIVGAAGPLRTTTKSAGADSCFLAKEQSWRTAWRAHSLLSWTRSTSPPGHHAGFRISSIAIAGAGKTAPFARKQRRSRQLPAARSRERNTLMVRGRWRCRSL